MNSVIICQCSEHGTTGFHRDENESISEQEQWEWIWSNIRRISEQRITTNTNNEWEASWTNNDGDWATQPPVCGRNDGVPNRVDRLKGLGNAIVPQIAYELFKVIGKMNN